MDDGRVDDSVRGAAGVVRVVHRRVRRAGRAVDRGSNRGEDPGAGDGAGGGAGGGGGREMETRIRAVRRRAGASDDGGTGSGDGDGDGDDAMSTVATREVKAVDARGGGAGDARGPLDERETRLLESLQERLRKVNDERDSIIYLVRKIQGKALDGGDQAKTELTEEEIEELTERLALASESKSLLKKIGLGR